MPEDQIPKIAAITERMGKEPYLDAAAQSAGRPRPDPIAVIREFERRLNELRGPGDDTPAMLLTANAEEAVQAACELAAGTPQGDMLIQGVGPAPAKRDYALGITSAQALIASTGTIVLGLDSAAQGYASLLVDRHIVVAHIGLLIPDLPTLYAALGKQAGGKLINIVCITGCSRTADIEKTLVVPAHGPREVRVVLSQSPLDWPALRDALKARLTGP